MSNVISLDFSNVKELTNLPAGKHVLKVKKYEQVTASTGSPMITVTFENAKGDIGIDNFVLTENALWKLKSLMVALFKQNFTGAFNFDLDTMIGRTCTAVAKEEEYVKQDGTPSIRTVLDNYMPVNDADAMGVTPNAPVPPMAQPQAPVPPVAPQVAPQPAVAPQPQMQPQMPGYVNPVYGQPETQPQINLQPQVQPQAVAQPQPQVATPQPQPAVAPQPAQPTPAPATPVAKRPWEM